MFFPLDTLTIVALLNTAGAGGVTAVAVSWSIAEVALGRRRTEYAPVAGDTKDYTGE